MVKRTLPAWAFAVLVWLAPCSSNADMIGCAMESPHLNLTISARSARTPGIPSVGAFLAERGIIPSRQGERTEDKPALGLQHEAIVRAMNEAALGHASAGRYEDAEATYLKTIEISDILFEERPAISLRYTAGLGLLYMEQARYDRAEPLLAKVLDSRRRILGQENEATLASRNDLATLYVARGRYSDAEPLLTEALEIGRRVYTQEHPLVLSSMNRLAVPSGISMAPTAPVSTICWHKPDQPSWRSWRRKTTGAPMLPRTRRWWTRV